METVSLRPMGPAEFEQYAIWSVADYGRSLIESGMETEQTAMDAALQEFREAFPAGVDSEYVHSFVIATGSGEAVGVMLYEVDPVHRRGFLLDFVIVQAQRGKGYGKAAMAEVLKDAKARGIETLGLNVFHHNRAAMHLYESYGFRPVKVFDGNSILERSTES